MYVSMKEIQKLFKGFSHITTDSKQSYCLSSFHWLHSGDIPFAFSEHCLYVIDNREIALQYCPKTDASFLILTDSLSNSAPFLKNDHSLLPRMVLETTDVSFVCDKLQHYFDDVCGMGLFADSLLEILFFEGGIQAMLDKIYPTFQNPIYVFDPDFKLIAATVHSDDILDEQSASILANGGFTEKEYDVINRSRIHQRVRTSERPVRSVHPLYGYDQLICAIDTKKDMGHIVINVTNRPLRDLDEQMLYILKMAIDQQMKKDEFIRNNRGFNYEYFLRDLLEEKMAGGRTLEHGMKYANDEFSGNLYCVVIETARSSNTLNTMHIRSVFESEFPGTMSLMYQGAIILLLRLANHEFLSSDSFEKINQICRENGLYAGLGNCFQNILKIKEYYIQALRSIELGVCRNNTPGLFLYNDHYLEHIANLFSQRESLDTFCHPQLKILLDYDKEHSTNYARILYTWLISERNMATTAKELYLHRNTLIYRMKKINSLINVDFDDYNERLRMILSYEFYQAE